MVQTRSVFCWIALFFRIPLRRDSCAAALAGAAFETIVSICGHDRSIDRLTDHDRIWKQWFQKLLLLMQLHNYPGGAEYEKTARSNKKRNEFVPSWIVVK